MKFNGNYMLDFQKVLHTRQSKIIAATIRKLLEGA